MGQPFSKQRRSKKEGKQHPESQNSKVQDTAPEKERKRSLSKKHSFVRRLKRREEEKSKTVESLKSSQEVLEDFQGKSNLDQASEATPDAIPIEEEQLPEQLQENAVDINETPTERNDEQTQHQNQQSNDLRRREDVSRNTERLVENHHSYANCHVSLFLGEVYNYNNFPAEYNPQGGNPGHGNQCAEANNARSPAQSDERNQRHMSQCESNAPTENGSAWPDRDRASNNENSQTTRPANERSVFASETQSGVISSQPISGQADEVHSVNRERTGTDSQVEMHPFVKKRSSSAFFSCIWPTDAGETTSSVKHL